MTTILVILVCAVAAIGFIAGIVKGYTKTRAWGAIVLVTALLIKLICSKTEDMGGKGEFILLATLGSILVFMLLFTLIKKYIGKKVKSAQTLSEYKFHDEREENTERILTALEAGDKKTYKRSSKRKFKAKSGVWGFINRLFGGITVGLNCLLTVSIVISVVLAMVDFVQIDSLTNLFADALASKIWVDLGAPLTFDLLVCSILYASIRVGFKGGISGALCTIIIVALIVLSGYFSYHLAFEVNVFVNGASEMAAGSLSSLISSIAGVTSMVGMDEVKVAQIIIMVGLFLIFLIAVIICAIFFPKLVEKFRGEKAFYIVDGVLGAIILTVIVFGIIIMLFGTLYTLSDLPAFYKFNGYIFSSPITNALYANNPLERLFGVFDNLPFRGWFKTE